MQGATFEFFLGVRSEKNGKLSEKEKFTNERFKTCSTLLELVQKALSIALNEHGLGAKTAVGYGYFNVPEQAAKVIDHANAERQRTEEAEHLRRESLSEVDRVCEDLTGLKNVDRSYDIFSRLEKGGFEGEDKKKVAHALKELWQKFGKWSGGQLTEKQRKKVQYIKTILGE